MDDLSITIRELTAHVANVSSKVDGPQPELTSSLYILQDSLNKLIALLNSKVVDVTLKDPDSANEITTFVQTCKTMSDRLTTIPKNEVKAECGKLTELLTIVKTMRLNFEKYCSGLIDYQHILGVTSQHIEQVITENEMDPGPEVQVMVQLMSEVHISVNSLGRVLPEPHKQPAVWLTECFGLIDGIDKIVVKLNGSSTSNALVNECLKNYGKTFARQLTQLKFLCCCYGFGVSVSSYEYISFATILKDLAYMLSPILLKVKEGDKK
jgi:hypothetical protein